MIQPYDEPVDHDFDAAWAERRARAKRVRILGKVYTLPASMPAKVILFTAQLQQHKAEDKVEPAKLLDMLRTLLGGDALDTILDDGLGLDEMSDLLGYCMKTLRAGAPEGEAPAPAMGAAPTTSSAAS